MVPVHRRHVKGDGAGVHGAGDRANALHTEPVEHQKDLIR
jgi:hypothetical protein